MKMYSGRNSLCNLGGSEYVSPRKNVKTFATQTDLSCNISLLEFLLCSKNLVISEDSKNIYSMLLNYLNDFHQLLNGQLANQKCEHVKSFKIPDIPNYSFFYDILMEKEKNWRKIDSDISLDYLDNTRKVQKIHSSGKTLIPHLVSERKLDNNAQRMNLKEYNNDLAHKMSEIISAVNTAKTCHKNNCVRENDARNICEDECIVLSKYHDEGNEK